MTKQFDKKDIARIARRINSKKTIHVAMPKDVHADVRIALFKHGGLSIQAVLEEVLERIAMQENYMVNLMEYVLKKKRNKEKEKLCETDVNDLFNMLEQGSPLVNNKDQRKRDE